MVEMSDFFEKLKSGAGKVAKEADQFAHVKRIELDIGSIRKQVEDNYKRLGEMTYRSATNKEPENPEAQSVMAKITELNKQISAKEEEIKAINQGGGVQPAQQTPETPKPIGKKFCPNCGRENEESAKFCINCGAKLG